MRRARAATASSGLVAGRLMYSTELSLIAIGRWRSREADHYSCAA
jgi:hypothetical protein